MIDTNILNTYKFSSIFSNVVYTRTYARWLSEEQRREYWPEGVDRYIGFLKEEIVLKRGLPPESLKYVLDLLEEAKQEMLVLGVVGSMRALWTAGKALSIENACSYNCAYTTIEHFKDFAEILYLLMCGCGVSYSAERQFITKLSTIPASMQEDDRTIVFEDSKQGWAEGYYKFLSHLSKGYIPKYDLSRIRKKGMILKTFGGRSSGPEPLRDLLNFTVRLFKNAQGNKFTSEEVSDLVCKIADIVVVGGARRSATLALTNPSDRRMAEYKKGDYFREHSHRSLVNVSSCYTDLKKPGVLLFLEDMTHLIESKSGERGFVNRLALQAQLEKLGRPVTESVGVNPCFVGETVVAVADGRNGVSIKELSDLGSSFPVYSARRRVRKNQTGSCGYQDGWKSEIKSAIAFKSGTKDTVEVLLSDGSSFECTPDHRLAIPSGSYVEAKDSVGLEIEKFFTYSSSRGRKYRHINSTSNGYSRQHNMIWESSYGSYDTHNFELHHKDGIGTNDSISNLELISKTGHTEKHDRTGSNNAWSKFKISNPEVWKWEQDRKRILLNAGRYNWTDERREEELGKLPPRPEKVEPDPDQILSDRVFVVSVTATGNCVDVYDLTVDDNHNFYIITESLDNDYLNCSGVLVHNCAEIILQSKGFCNLSEIIVREGDSLEILKRKSRLATVLGFLQSMLTNFKFISPKWKQNCVEDRILGLSLTGLRDHEVLSVVGYEAEGWLEAMYYEAHAIEHTLAAMFGVEPAKAITCVKPSGTVSQLVNSASGLHVRYSKEYIRRIRMAVNDPLAKLLIAQGMDFAPENGETYENARTYVFSFPIQAPSSSKVKAEVSALQQLDYWKMLKTSWCDHNPSCTVYVRDHEWVSVSAWVYENFDILGGISFLPDENIYEQAPYEEITNDDYNLMLSKFPMIDLTKLSDYEAEDYTTGAQEAACSGGNCELN